ncbi:MAG: hypothetical protein LKCHEGNO_02048 [Burkholderiaceae bacterium]|nr:hypothetical protein [Burkholderiaceae bacterium]
MRRSRRVRRHAPLWRPRRPPAIAAAAIASDADRHAAEHDRLGALVRVGLEALDHLAHDLLVDQALDVAQEQFLVDAHQRDRLAAGAGAASAADAVHVVLGHVGDLEVHHVRQLVDVDAARRDVGGHQHAQLAALELGQRLGARALALVAVDRHRGDVVAVEVLGELVGAVLGAREHQHLVPVALRDQVRQQLLLALAAHRVHLLRHQLGRRVASRHLDQRRLVQQPVGQRLDVVAEGGREQQALLSLRQDREHLLDVVDEAHVEHAVGLVEHEHLHVAQVERALTVVVEQPAGRGHQDVDAAPELVDLRLHADTAEHHHALQAQVAAVGANAFLHLRGQFARGRQDQAADRDAAACVANRRLRRQPLQHR